MRLGRNGTIPAVETFYKAKPPTCGAAMIEYAIFGLILTLPLLAVAWLSQL